MNTVSPLAEAEALLHNVVKLTHPPQLVERTPGRSGARTYEVIANSRHFLLKIDAPGRSIEAFQRALAIQRAAANCGTTPAVRSWSDARRTILSDYVHDVSFVGAVFNSTTQSNAVLAGLAQAIAALHALDVRSFQAHSSPLQQSREMLTRVSERFEVPDFAANVWRDLTARSPMIEQNTLCHLDLNPTNILFDGRKIWLVDWDTAGPGDRWLDLATVSNMLLLDRDRRRRWIQQYTDSSGVAAPEKAVLAQARRLSYAAYGCAFLELVKSRPKSSLRHETSLAECYAAMAKGRLDLNSDSGRWQLSAAHFAGYWEVA